MLFNSYIFIFIFLPLCLGGYFFLNRLGLTRPALAFLFGMSLWFYGFFNPSYLAIIISSILINYFFYRLSKKVTDSRLRKWLKILAVSINLGILFYFKYFDFFVSNINSVFGTDFILRNIVLPLGISFFTFQQLSFVVDAFNGEVPDYDFLSYACFVTFFPQLIAGPIVTHDELVPQLMDQSRKRFNPENFSAGLFMFALGMGKKVLLADSLGPVVDHCFAAVGDYRFEQINSVGAWVGGLCYTMQIYLDFSGYSDIAIGIGRMFNVELPVNFNSPYKAITIVDHWKRWHLTLTRFLTKYIYLPLGGSRKGELRTYFNIMMVYLLSGIWHGAGWTYICWGVVHGIANGVFRRFRHRIEKLPDFVNWLITFVFIVLLDTVFRANSLRDACVFLSKMIVFRPGPLHPEIAGAFIQPEFLAPFRWLLGTSQPELIALPVFIFVCLFLILCTKNTGERLAAYRPTLINSLTTAALLVWCILSFAGVSTFLYFNF